MRIPGVGSQYSDLLEAAGVDSPAELARRNAANLATTFAEVAAAKPGIVRRVPGESEVAEWIAAAGSIDKVVTSLTHQPQRTRRAGPGAPRSRFRCRRVTSPPCPRPP